MSLTLTQTWYIAGSLVDADSTPTLSDPTSSYGIKRDDSDEVVVASATALTKTATGTYTYTLTEPEPGLTYTAYVRLVYLGVAYHLKQTLTGSNTLISFPTTITGDYITSLDMAYEWGKQNLIIWADLDNDRNASTIEDRLQDSINQAEYEVNSVFERSQYVIPFSPVPDLIKRIVRIKAGAILYEPRSVEDFTSEGGQATKTLVTAKNKRADELMQRILANKLVLSDATLKNTGLTNAPFLVKGHYRSRTEFDNPSFIPLTNSPDFDPETNPNDYEP